MIRKRHANSPFGAHGSPAGTTNHILGRVGQAGAAAFKNRQHILVDFRSIALGVRESQTDVIDFTKRTQ
jgi:hypothetical protein